MEIALIAGAVVVAIAAALAIMAWLNARRRLHLLAKYGDDEAVNLIMHRKVWEGMTQEQLIDSWGHPAEIDERVLKTKTAHVYKYNPSGKNAFRDRVKLDDGVVIGWDQRGKR